MINAHACEYVLYPYEFTLLSNIVLFIFSSLAVLYPYEFTLLSNTENEFAEENVVLYPYEFTLLSNRCCSGFCVN